LGEELFANLDSRVGRLFLQGLLIKYCLAASGVWKMGRLLRSARLDSLHPSMTFFGFVLILLTELKIFYRAN